VTARSEGAEAFGDLTSEQVARLDAAALELGVTTLQLMEIAGWQVARCAWQRIGRRPREIAVVAGHGNNGGDGLVAARHLATWGCAVRVLVAADESRVVGLVRDHIVVARRCGVEVTVSADPAAAQSGTAGATLVLDAILGTGLRSAPRDLPSGAIRALNAGKAPILSVDVPSGLDATTGEAFDPCVRATLTCALTAMKRGLWSEAGGIHAGELWVADIGMPATAWERVGLRQPPGVTGGELVHTSSASPP
jgi:ADP-dependent NAD(P)H-hydrate dehydratase / NAD(P)H-hydrate epimerase